MEQMTQEASAIVHGTCVATQSQWVGRSLVTDATISVEEALKGDAAIGSNVTVELPGGISANGRFPVAMTYAGAPQISPTKKSFSSFTAPGQRTSTATR